MVVRFGMTTLNWSLYSRCDWKVLTGLTINAEGEIHCDQYIPDTAYCGDCVLVSSHRRPGRGSLQRLGATLLSVVWAVSVLEYVFPGAEVSKHLR